MKITIVGTGYVGLVTGVCLANLGNDIICVDIDKEKINLLKSGHPTIYEPGLEELLNKNLEKSRISFTTSIKEGVEKSDIIFIAVGTPEKENGEADMSAVWEVAKNIGLYMNDYKIVINKSTVPVGSGEKVQEIIEKNLKKKIKFDVVSNPEFLREGSAINDFMEPDRIIIGSNHHAPAKIIKRLYEPLNAPIIITDLKSAEIIKYASNAFLATKISFINEIANFSQLVDANISDIAKGMGLDSRIGDKFLNAGIGYGGSCFPKDTIALVTTGEKYNYEFKIIKSTIEVNKLQRERFFNLIKNYYQGKMKDKAFGIWGLAFKPNTDDMREAPSIDIIKQLKKHTNSIKAFDPVAQKEALKIFPDLKFEDSPYNAAKDCDALLILTEWDEFKQIDLEKLKQLMKKPVIFDGRNVYDPQIMQENKITYISIGRKPLIFPENR